MSYLRSNQRKFITHNGIKIIGKKNHFLKNKKLLFNNFRLQTNAELWNNQLNNNSRKIK